MRHFKAILIAVFSLTLAFTLAACSQSQQTARNKVQVVSSLNFYGDIAKAVGGKHVQVTSIINKASIDPHDYEPSAANAKEYARAQLIISNGAGYDSWSQHYAKQNASAKSITVAHLLKWQNGTNEHLWYKPAMAATLARKLCTELSTLAPKHRAYFEKRRDAYLTNLNALSTLQKRAQTALAGKRYMATEPVYDNTLLALGAKQLNGGFARAVDEGNDPTTAQLRTWQRATARRSVAFVVNNPQNSSKLVRNAIQNAKKHKVPIVTITETMPNGENYIQWQSRQLRAVIRATASTTKGN
ncbi:metal ABC transporter solute-binding protein, Zn/Mn family [Lacticaseibacillus songhuajiangensis]|uniref:metal ABC transporter solute-binding protein, Zn/Mn family n=1 Tax=Lacticaseibacillus songhuajiangensis TaxID=1296539 RepID=UPI000F7A8CC6|nr:zinc ABC transporter substrate-binding protein [Lacticaseibacillus songhuajiangensis]